MTVAPVRGVPTDICGLGSPSCASKDCASMRRVMSARAGPWLVLCLEDRGLGPLMPLLLRFRLCQLAVTGSGVRGLRRLLRAP